MAEVNGKPTSQVPEGMPPSPTPGSGGQQQQPTTPQAAPAEQVQPQYLTKEDALALIAARDKEWQDRYEQLAKEQGKRGAQSYLDKRRLEQRMQTTEATIEAMIQDGLLDASQASIYRERARTAALTDLLTEEEEQPQPGGETGYVSPAQAQMDQVAWTLINQAGLTEQDPEFQMLMGYNDFPSWHTALQTASAAKAARLVRENAQAGAKPPAQPPAQPQQPTPPTGAQAVEVGAGGGPGQALDRASLGKQMNEAARRGDRAEVERIRGLLQDKGDSG